MEWKLSQDYLNPSSTKADDSSSKSRLHLINRLTTQFCSTQHLWTRQFANWSAHKSRRQSQQDDLSQCAVVFCLISNIECSNPRVRSHNNKPDWISDCYDHASNQLMNPFCLTQGCSAPKTVAHSQMDSNITFYMGGSKVTYTCNPLYALEGPSSITCIQDPNNGLYVWTVGPRCNKKVYECAPLPQISDGHHAETYNRTINSTVTYACDRGFKLIGHETVTCVLAINQSTITWTERPSCVPGCSAPVAVAHAQIDFNTTFYVGGYNATYTCDPLYVLVGPPSITCIQDSNNGIYVWTQGPRCNKEIHECRPLSQISNGRHAETYNRTVNSTVVYTCDLGFELIGHKTVTCVLAINKSMANWTERPSCVPECGPLSQISNGKHAETYNRTVNSTVVYTCDLGFELIGQKTVTCVLAINQSMANWTERPSCVPECGPLPQISNGKDAETYNRTVSSTVVYTCSQGFKLIGQETVTCVLAFDQSTATWTERPSCVPDTGTSGLQFIFGIPQNTPKDQTDYKMYIASKYVSTVYITAPGIGFNLNITTLANTTTVVTIPDSIIATSAGVSNKAIYILTDKPVSVYVIVRVDESSEGFLILPISADANEFIVASYDTIESYPSEFLITAFEDNTWVDVNFRMSAGSITIGGQSYISGQNVSFAMDKMQTYLVQHHHDLTGTHITSSKPVSVVSGNVCANVPQNIQYCDFVAEQLLPVRFWEHEYVCAKLKTRRNNRFRVLSSMDNNAVNIGGTQVSLNDGDFYEYVSSKDAATAVISTHPVLVIQYAEGTNADYVIGDPSMITVPSTDNQESEYFYETPTNITFHYASITIHTDHGNDLRIDGATIDRSDELKTTINTTEFSIIRVSVTAGQHHIYHVDPSVSFGVIVYGFKLIESYGFPLGLVRNGPTGVKRNKRSMTSTTPYAVQTQFYIDPNFQQEISGNPLDVRTGVNLFVKAFVKNVDWTMKMRLYSCYAERTLNGLDARYYLINNGCEIDANTQILSQTDHETRFMFQAFQMTGPYHRFHIKCDATRCDTSDVTSSQRCDQRPNCAKL